MNIPSLVVIFLAIIVLYVVIKRHPRYALFLMAVLARGQIPAIPNDNLDVGDIDMPSIFDTLIRFRSHAIALTADIEKAFLQIGVKEADRSSLRFL